MKRKITIMASIVVVLLVSIAGYKRITAPSTYEECVLQHISEAQSDKAAMIVHAACRSQFPEDISYKSAAGSFSYEEAYPVTQEQKQPHSK